MFTNAITISLQQQESILTLALRVNDEEDRMR